jgi:predicted nucleic acid-binding protein
VPGYLLDTSVLSPLVDSGHARHAAARAAVAALGTSPIYVSAIALAEMMYGIRLHEMATGSRLLNATAMIASALLYPQMDVTRHTATEYAELKSLLAIYYLPKVTRQFRRRWIEEWIDRFTGRALHIDDNDLWICAQGRENNLIVIVGDRRMGVIRTADPTVNLLIV